MSDIRHWIEGKLHPAGYSTTRTEPGGLLVARSGFPDSRVMCVGLSNGESFDAEGVDKAIAVMPNLEFIAVVPTRIKHAAFERAEQRGICVAGFGELSSALKEDADISAHIDTQERFERDRLENNRAVRSLKRRGHHAYEIQRRNRLRPLTIVTTNDYEFTVDRLYDILDSYGGIDPDMVVITNPNCHGLSTDSLRAAEDADVPLVLFRDFLRDLGAKWT